MFPAEQDDPDLQPPDLQVGSAADGSHRSRLEHRHEQQDRRQRILGLDGQGTEAVGFDYLAPQFEAQHMAP